MSKARAACAITLSEVKFGTAEISNITLDRNIALLTLAFSTLGNIEALSLPVLGKVKRSVSSRVEIRFQSHFLNFS